MKTLRYIWIDHANKTRLVLMPKVASTSMRYTLSAWKSKVTLAEAPEFDDYLTIAFVRHPFDRLWSAFHDPSAFGRYSDHPRSWESFVNEMVIGVNPAAMNPHVRPQSLLLRDLRVDMLGRFDSLERDWDSVREVTSWPKLRHDRQGPARPAWQSADYDWSKTHPIYFDDLTLYYQARSRFGLSSQDPSGKIRAATKSAQIRATRAA